MVNNKADATRYSRNTGKLPDNVRLKVLETFCDVFKEDQGILNDLRDRHAEEHSEWNVDREDKKR